MLKILIVEDEKPISDLIKLSLLGEGYCCTCVYDGQAAADRIENENFDLVLLDIMLPKIARYELLEYMKHTRDFPDRKNRRCRPSAGASSRSGRLYIKAL